jgi:hypothetical protein
VRREAFLELLAIFCLGWVVSSVCIYSPGRQELCERIRL